MNTKSKDTDITCAISPALASQLALRKKPEERQVDTFSVLIPSKEFWVDATLHSSMDLMKQPLSDIFLIHCPIKY